MGLDWAVFKPADSETKLDSEVDQEVADDSSDDDNALFTARVSSYSGVHAIRRLWVEKAAEYEPALKRLLDKWTAPSDAFSTLLSSFGTNTEYASLLPTMPLNYGAVPRRRKSLSEYTFLSPGNAFLVDGEKKVPRLTSGFTDAPIEDLDRLGFPPTLYGLYNFVNKSDADGFYTALEAQQMWDSYTVLRPLMDKAAQEWQDQFMQACLVAVEHNLPITQC